MDGHKRLRATRFDGGTAQHPAPSSGFIALYLALQLCQKVAVYGMSLEASREGDEMRAPYHYFHNYVDSERLRAHPHHAFNLEGDLLRQWDAAGVVTLCDSSRKEGTSCGVDT